MMPRGEAVVGARAALLCVVAAACNGGAMSPASPGARSPADGSVPPTAAPATGAIASSPAFDPGPPPRAAGEVRWAHALPGMQQMLAPGFTSSGRPVLRGAVAVSGVSRAIPRALAGTQSFLVEQVDAATGRADFAWPSLVGTVRTALGDAGEMDAVLEAPEWDPSLTGGEPGALLHVARLDASGRILASRSLGVVGGAPWLPGLGGDIAGVASTPGGGVVVASTYGIPVAFGTTVLRPPAGADLDMFVLELGPSLDVRAAYGSASTGQAPEPAPSAIQAAGGLAVDPSGNLLVGGWVVGRRSVFGCPLTPEASARSAAGFVASLRSGGRCNWVRSWPGWMPSALAADPRGGGVVVGAALTAKALGPDAAPPQPSDAHAGFAVSLAEDGTPRWTRIFPCPQGCQLRAVSVDRWGEVVAGGFFAGSMLVGAHPIDARPGSPREAVIKLSPTGAPLWEKSFGAQSMVSAVAAGPEGQIALLDVFEGAPPIADPSYESHPGGGTLVALLSP